MFTIYGKLLYLQLYSLKHSLMLSYARHTIDYSLITFD